ncbi:MAG: histidine kinase [Flavobacteriales bacterium]
MRSFFALIALSGPFCVGRAQDTLPDPVRVARQAMQAASREQYSERACELAAAYRAADMQDSARAAADRALRYARDDRERARAHFAIARVLTKEQDNLGAQEHARQTILLARAANDTSTWIRGEAMLAEVDIEHNRYSTALTHAQLVRQLALATKDTAALATVHAYLGSIFYREHNYDSARWHYDASIAFIPRTEPQRRLMVRMNQVNLFIEEGRYDSAMARSDAMRTEVEHSNMYTRSKYHNQRGYALFNAGHFREAIPEFALSDSLNGAEVKELDLSIENTGFLAESYAAIGDSAKGYVLLLDLEVLKDSFNRAAADEQMLTLEKRFETKLNKEEIQRLDGENKQKAERLRVQNMQLYGSLALAAMAIGAVMLVWRNLAQKRKHAAVLESLNAELRDKQARIEQINGLLRMKVLRTQMDPHFIHNCLNAIRALSLKGEHERAEEYLEGFARLLRNVLEHSVRDRISLDEELAFLNDYVVLEQLRLGDDFTWSITADEALLKEEPQVPSLLVQPFVENAIWHGLAPKQVPKRLEVHFSLEDGVVTCRVEDNGVGRSDQTSTPGRASLGLKLTGERLELLTDRVKSQGGFLIEDLKDARGGACGTRISMKLQA